MIIIMETHATDAQIQDVIQHVEDLGFRVVVNTGDVMTVISAIGDKRLVDMHTLEALDGVREIVPIQEPFKMASRQVKPHDTVIRFDNGVQIGGDARAVMMAGPCSIEADPDILLRTAETVKRSGATFLRGGAFKPRSSPYDFQGLEEEGLKQLADAREATGLLVITEVMDTTEVPLVAEYADVLQIGARNMQNFKMLKALGSCGRPVMLKRGLSATIKEFLLAAEYILAHGNDQVILCERGIRGFDSSITRNVLDLAAVPVIKHLSHLPVIVDPSHGTGRRFLIEPMCQAAIMAGADGLMVEVHPNPDKALSDGAQTLNYSQFENMMGTLNQVIDFYQNVVLPSKHPVSSWA
jgi:3-deoxy-7-phosphoheptulonate synthase